MVWRAGLCARQVPGGANVNSFHFQTEQAAQIRRELSSKSFLIKTTYYVLKQKGPYFEYLALVQNVRWSSA